MNTAHPEQDQKIPYQQEIENVLIVLATDAQRGLSEGEARARLDRYGKNELEAEKPVPRWKKFLAQFQNVLVMLLLIATAISAGLWLYERAGLQGYNSLVRLTVIG